MKSKAQRDLKARIRNDIIFIASFLAAVILFGLFVFYMRGEGAYAVVSVDGRVRGEYSLSEDISVMIETEFGTNRLIIKDGKAFVTDASCPDGICVAHRAIHREGESIVCLPNRLTVTVTGNGSGSPDLIT